VVASHDVQARDRQASHRARGRRDHLDDLPTPCVPTAGARRARLRRQQILGTLDYTAFLGGAALRTPFGGADALREQLRHLIAARNRGILIRIVPEHAPHLVVIHSWLLMEFPNATPVVNVEARNGSLYLHDEIALTYLDLAGQLDRIALSAPASLAMMGKLLEEG
jgi:hypothetical protein